MCFYQWTVVEKLALSRRREIVGCSGETYVVDENFMTVPNNNNNKRILCHQFPHCILVILRDLSYLTKWHRKPWSLPRDMKKHKIDTSEFAWKAAKLIPLFIFPQIFTNKIGLFWDVVRHLFYGLSFLAHTSLAVTFLSFFVTALSFSVNCALEIVLEMITPIGDWYCLQDQVGK